MKLKSAVKVTDSKLHPHTYVAGSLRDVEHDAAVAHALMQALEEFEDERDAEYTGDPMVRIMQRSDEIMREWGLDSGEVE